MVENLPLNKQWEVSLNETGEVTLPPSEAGAETRVEQFVSGHPTPAGGGWATLSAIVKGKGPRNPGPTSPGLTSSAKGGLQYSGDVPAMVMSRHLQEPALSMTAGKLRNQPHMIARSGPSTPLGESREPRIYYANPALLYDDLASRPFSLPTSPLIELRDAQPAPTNMEAVFAGSGELSSSGIPVRYMKNMPGRVSAPLAVRGGASSSPGILLRREVSPPANVPAHWFAWISGRWASPVGDLTISGQEVRDNDGNMGHLSVNAEGILTLVFEGEVWQAIQEESNRVEWDNGDVWHRLHTPGQPVLRSVHNLEAADRGRRQALTMPHLPSPPMLPLRSLPDMPSPRPIQAAPLPDSQVSIPPPDLRMTATAASSSWVPPQFHNRQMQSGPPTAQSWTPGMGPPGLSQPPPTAQSWTPGMGPPGLSQGRGHRAMSPNQRGLGVPVPPSPLSAASWSPPTSQMWLERGMLPPSLPPPSFSHQPPAAVGMALVASPARSKGLWHSRSAANPSPMPQALNVGGQEMMESHVPDEHPARIAALDARVDWLTSLVTKLQLQVRTARMEAGSVGPLPVSHGIMPMTSDFENRIPIEY